MQNFAILFKKWVERFFVLLRYATLQTKKIKPPLFKGLSLYDIVSFFLKGLYEGAITMRAGAISFSLFMALFPGIIFIFTLIPYVPIEGFQDKIFLTLQDVLPRSTYEATKDTILDILNTKRGNLLSITFVFALIFATNGTLALLSGFTYSYHKIDFKSFWHQYLSAFLLTIVLSVLVLFSLILVSFGETFFNWLASQGYFEYNKVDYILIGRIIVLIITIQLSISLLYSYGSVKGGQWKFISPGSILATILVILSSIAFSFYLDNFAQYNKLYGSIGTLLVIMLWIYINAIGLIIGFELNASIAGAKTHNAKKYKQPFL
jgi:membrane protein